MSNNNLEAFLQSIIVASSDAELVPNTVLLPQLKDLLRAVVIETFDQELKPVIKDLFRTVVQEVLESKLSVVQRNLEDEIRATSNPRTLKLKFIEKAVVSPIYTGVEIKGEGGCPFRVALFDDITGNIVDSGPNASLEVEIVVLKFEFGAGGNDSWTAREFIDSIVRERETLRNSLRTRSSSLLTERVVVKLDKGVGDVHNVKFRHTASHMKNTRYRLGAHVTDDRSRGATRIQEAITEPFVVKDKHILRNAKHFTPSLSDDVWRLVHIGRHTYCRLQEKRVLTVEDFLILHLRDPMLLERTLRMKPSAFEETLNNAKRCNSNKIYYHTNSHRNKGVVFNIFGQVLGLILQSQYIPADELSQDEKANAPQLLASAYEHWEEEVECFDELTSLEQKFPKLSRSKSFIEIMIKELHHENVVFHIKEDGAGSRANDFGSTTCPWNTDELMALSFEWQANEASRASNEPRDGSVANGKVLKKWKILVNIVKWLTQRRDEAIVEVHVQKKPRHS
ncbi:calmodulin-binding protein 60 A-like isoform X2 [Ipomoea triloba]|uniref:calmodulin-binding protein 60 A-like isoform X2 n=1 Tax=Ipomoea triloba TaxID=35885 RepID=UPI00125E9B99|nr:calmodulin-binding protein 60 A-like isoform X2 [Ipomoea triloba]